jgi:hypothetical protein
VTRRSEGYLRFLEGVVMNVAIWVLQILLAVVVAWARFGPYPL